MRCNNCESEWLESIRSFSSFNLLCPACLTLRTQNLQIFPLHCKWFLSNRNKARQKHLVQGTTKAPGHNRNIKFKYMVHETGTWRLWSFSIHSTTALVKINSLTPFKAFNSRKHKFLVHRAAVSLYLPSCAYASIIPNSMDSLLLYSLTLLPYIWREYSTIICLLSQ